MAWALGLGALAQSGPAHAAEIQGTAAFAVAKDPSGQKAAAVVDAVIRTRVTRARELRPIEPARVLSGDPRTREEETLERARAALADGRRAYDALSLDDAIARLGQAVSLYQQTGPLLGDLEELQVALAYLGAALVLRGSADEGQSTFIELLTVNASYQLEGFPPAVENIFDQAMKRVDATPPGAVEIYSTPPYAAVFLDGRFEGVTPVTLTDVVAGTHYIRLEKIGYTVHGAPLEISPNQRITSQTRLSSIKRGAELRDLTARAAEEVSVEGMGGALRALARELVADTLIFVAVTQSGRDATLTGAVFDGATGTRLATERAVLGVESATFDRELDEYADRLVKAAVRGTPAGDVGAMGGGGSGGAFGLGGGGVTKSGGGGTSTSPLPGYVAAPVGPRATPSEVYLGWTLIGIGSASIVTGIVFGILSKLVHSDFKKTSQLSSELDSIRDKGKTNALVADLCFLGGGLAVIGGTTILLITASQAPSPGDLIQNPTAGLAPIEGGAVFSFGASF